MRYSKGENFLVSGPSGVGKTTLIKRLADTLSPAAPAGFYTEDLMVSGKRVGFTLTSLCGETLKLPYKDASLPRRHGRFAIKGELLLPFIEKIKKPDPTLVMIDEIGKLEGSSRELRDEILGWIAGPEVFVATLPERGPGFVDLLKARGDISLYNLSVRNRDTLFKHLTDDIDSELT